MFPFSFLAPIFLRINSDFCSAASLVEVRQPGRNRFIDRPHNSSVAQTTLHDLKITSRNGSFGPPLIVPRSLAPVADR